MISHLRRRLPKRRVGIVPERHHPRIRNLLRQEVARPERIRLGVRPCRDRIAAQSVYGDDTNDQPWSANIDRAKDLLNQLTRLKEACQGAAGTR